MAKGRVAQVIGTVVDIEFPPEELPALYNAIEIPREEGNIVLEVEQHIGNNWVMHDGRIGVGASDEPYLSDAIAVPAALVQGILGIRQTNEALEVQPVLPAALPRVSAEVVHLGVRKRVTIDGRNVKVEDLDRVFTPPRELTWRVTAGCPPEAGMHIDRTFETGRGWTATPEIAIRSGRGLTVWRVPTSPPAGRPSTCSRGSRAPG